MCHSPTASFGGRGGVSSQQLLIMLHTKCCEGNQNAMELGKPGLQLGEENSNMSVTGLYESRKAESKNYFSQNCVTKALGLLDETSRRLV